MSGILSVIVKPEVVSYCFKIIHGSEYKLDNGLSYVYHPAKLFLFVVVINGVMF